jgi:N-acetyl-anhydromuramyl-L-alanine amidase AmpD
MLIVCKGASEHFKEAVMATIADGKLIDPRVKMQIFSNLERGSMTTVNAIVIHQTDSADAAGLFGGYKNTTVGAHFLIDKDGTIYQTARITQKAHHVGKIRSKCLESHTCQIPEKKKRSREHDILYEKGKKLLERYQNSFEYERLKQYPDRYPTNDDSLGIEVVGRFIQAEQSYEAPTVAQILSIKFLISELQRLLELHGQYLYPHSSISRKNPTEALTIMPHLR